MLEFLEVQEEYIKDEQRNLKKEYLHAQEEVKRIQSVPLVIGQFLEAVDQNTGIVGSTTGSNYYVRILSTIDRELLKPSASVALHKHSNALVDVLPPEADSSISMLQADEKPDIQYSDIGGMDMQKQEIREAVELPLTHFELYKQIGIDPPRGVLMYGPPGCGKTMLAKAVARHTTAAFIRVVGSEFVQKYLGEGPRMVRDVFRLAKENSPAIIFVDEIDAIATKRFDAQTGADREVQRILLELLNQMDGFDQTTNVKVIMATNRADTLDPALLRPGRLDRKIEFPLPDRRQKRLIFSTITAKMNLSEEVDLEDYVARPDRISGADIIGALPFFISNSELSVTTNEMNIINDVFSCNIEFCSKSKYLPQSASINKNSKTNVCSKESWCDIFRFEYAVYKTLKILDKCVDNLHTNPPCKHHISMTLALFLYHIRYFLEYVLRRMYLKLEQERSKELYYRKLWHCQRKSIEDVAKSITDLEEQQINHKKMLEDTIKRYKKNIIAVNEIDERCNECITSTKLITESKLLTIMTKYDTEIDSRCKMLEQLSQIYKHHKLERHDLEV
ncbi:26S protease regulatory subunit 6B [Trachymyrmex zeteki]|uniref:26S protease regulatory subunit 6B n=1 Tax=Mycetomoellerius zeteki TaxID=64791 RepID=A0A151X5S2_9HYME|nr:26S protease regulatory subunit 6B [Trachymyrmex zeteki]